MEKKIEDYLPHYMGCLIVREGVTISSVLTHAQLAYISEFKIWNEIKPILRPLSDMTEEEKLEFQELCHLEKESLGCITVSWDVLTEKIELGTAHLTNVFQWTIGVKYLLSKHFDLFGLIEAGLAIDKTTLNP